MGSQWVEDPSWGNIFSSFSKQMDAAPGEALSNIRQAEMIKDARIKRAREEADYQRGIATGNAYEQTLPRDAPLSDYTAIGPMVGDVNNPADVAGIPTADLQYSDPRVKAQFDANRALAVATARQAAAAGKTNEIMPMLGYGSVATTGVPDSATERARLQFMTTGKFPTAEEAKPSPAHNLAIIGADGEPTGRSIATQDFKREAISGRPIGTLLKPGETVLASGPASVTPSNPFESEAVAQRGLEKIRADSAARGHMTEDEVRLATRLFDVAYPITRVTETEGGRLVEKQIRAKAIPPSQLPLYNLTQDYAAGKHLQPQAPGQPPPVQPLTTETTPPPVDPNASRVISKGSANPAELRKEYQNVQAVSDWAITAPLYNSAVKSAQNPTNQGDINIMYAFAKLMDPGSVVRDSEGKLVMQSGTIPQSIVGTFNKLIVGGGTMDPQVRLQLIDTLKNRLDETKGAKDIADKFYREKVAPAAGLDPNEIIIPAVEPIPYSPENILRGGNSAATTTQPPPATVKPRGADALVGGR